MQVDPDALAFPHFRSVSQRQGSTLSRVRSKSDRQGDQQHVVRSFKHHQPPVRNSFTLRRQRCSKTVVEVYEKVMKKSPKGEVWSVQCIAGMHESFRMPRRQNAPDTFRACGPCRATGRARRAFGRNSTGEPTGSGNSAFHCCRSLRRHPVANWNVAFTVRSRGRTFRSRFVFGRGHRLCSWLCLERFPAIPHW